MNEDATTRFDTPAPATPRPEYPRPILTRPEWRNLNGVWQFSFDPRDEGMTRGWFAGEFADALQITVPFSVESEASGIHDVSPSDVCWYARDFEVPESWNERVLLRFGACDHIARVFINGLEVGQHRGGYAPLAFEIQHAIRPGANRLVVRVEDSISWTQPRGKQAGTTRWPIDYDSVTGIWQTVWLEPLPNVSIEWTHANFSHESSRLDFTVGLSRPTSGTLEFRIGRDTHAITRESVAFEHRAEVRLSMQLPDAARWSPGNPLLHDVELRLHDVSGEMTDQVGSYVGLREFTTEDGEVRLNGAPLYLRGVLDQGYFPGGWYTALSDEALRRDVELTLALGFNCARKHQKAEDPRYLYWADRLGLLVWSEMPSGRIFCSELVESLTREWQELVQRDRAHPCVMAWVPFNESWGVWNQQHRPEQRAFVDGVVGLTRALDGTRLIVGNDGWEYSSGDLWTLHLYEPDGDLDQRLARLRADPSQPVTSTIGRHVRRGALAGADVSGLPILLTECGGIGFGRFGDDDFSYGDVPRSEAELEREMRRLVQIIANADALQGFVWTQLTDVQQETNGLLYFDRTPKLPIERLREIFDVNRRSATEDGGQEE